MGRLVKRFERCQELTCPVEVSFVSQELSSRYAPLKGDAVWLNVRLFSESGMDQYLLIPFLGGWTSINPSYFDVNYRGTRFWHTANHENPNGRWPPELLHLIGMSWPKATDMILGRWINGYRLGGLVGESWRGTSSWIFTVCTIAISYLYTIENNICHICYIFQQQYAVLDEIHVCSSIPSARWRNKRINRRSRQLKEKLWALGYAANMHLNRGPDEIEKTDPKNTPKQRRKSRKGVRSRDSRVRDHLSLALEGSNEKQKGITQEWPCSHGHWRPVLAIADNWWRWCRLDEDLSLPQFCGKENMSYQPNKGSKRGNRRVCPHSLDQPVMNRTLRLETISM